MGGRSCPAVGTKARQRCEAWRAIASKMNFTPELCRMSAGCDSLVSDNHTRQHQDGGERVQGVVLLCVCRHSCNVGL